MSRISSIKAIGRRPKATTTFRRASREPFVLARSSSSRGSTTRRAIWLFIPGLGEAGHDDPETVKLTGIYPDRCRAEVSILARRDPRDVIL
jgi:hypothetical protein